MDYHDLCEVNTTKEERRGLNIGDIYSNGLKCKKCGDYIRSKNRHDFVLCGCKACGIDGGSWYVRVVGNPEDFELMTVYFNDVELEEL